MKPIRIFINIIGSTKCRKNLFYDDEIRERLRCNINEIFDKKEDIELSEMDSSLAL